MKIYPDISKLWANKIREAGMTKNQAKKVFDETEKTNERVEKFIESNDTKGAKGRITEILKKLNVL